MRHVYLVHVVDHELEECKSTAYSSMKKAMAAVELLTCKSVKKREMLPFTLAEQDAMATWGAPKPVVRWEEVEVKWEQHDKNTWLLGEMSTVKIEKMEVL